MIEDNQSSSVHTNHIIFYEIAQQSFAAMSKDLDSNRRPKPGGKPGWVVSYDPDRKSFKSALTVIVFSGVWLESLLHLLIVEKEGVGVFKKFDNEKYEVKLKLLGCDDPSIIGLCEHYREVRREIVHEKAHLNSEKIRVAQKEAGKAIDLVNKVCAHFKLEIREKK